MADWSQLQKDILILISQRLKTDSDFIHFRSVCPTWRASAVTKPCRLPSYFQISEKNSSVANPWHLSTRSIFLIKSPEIQNGIQAVSNCQIVKINEDARGRMSVMHPLNNHANGFWHRKVLNLLNFRVIELSREYVVHHHRHLGWGCFDMKTDPVAFLSSSTENNNYALLWGRYGSLNLFRSEEREWTKIDDVYSGSGAIIPFKGKFYVVDRKGQTVAVDPSGNVSLLTSVRLWAKKRFLVESRGELLLVDILMRNNLERTNKLVQFRIFKLDEQARKWNLMKSLGDKMLFLGKSCSFSVSASQVGGCRGNCIVLREKFHVDREAGKEDKWEDNGVFVIDQADMCASVQIGDSDYFKYSLRGTDMFVFDLQNGSVKPLKDSPEHLKLFLPPSDWTISSRHGSASHVYGSVYHDCDDENGDLVQNTESSSLKSTANSSFALSLPSPETVSPSKTKISSQVFCCFHLKH